jgi:ankyrin repeat protein
MQGRVLTEGLDLEKESGQHQHFSRREDVPFVKVAEIAKGAFGYVDRVISTLSYREYARKQIPRGRTFKKNKVVLGDFERELATLKKLSHLHIVRLVGSYTDPKYVGILMLPIADCNLKEFLHQSVFSQESRSILRTFFGCLASAVCYLHENRIRHKDVKPENILVKDNIVYLADFGISLDWSKREHDSTSSFTLKTVRYCAPEVANCLRRNSSSDIWSLGCVFLEMWTVLNGKTVAGLITFLGGVETHSTYYHSNFPAVQRWYSIVKDSSASPADNIPLDWINKMLQLDQSDRCTARTLYEHIQDANADPENRFKFSGDCCVEGDDSSESVPSQTDIPDLLHRAMQTSIEQDQKTVNLDLLPMVGLLQGLSLSPVKDTTPNDDVSPGRFINHREPHTLSIAVESDKTPVRIIQSEAPTKWLRWNGFDLKDKGVDKERAVLWAAKNGHEAAVQLLLERGADIAAKDQREATVLHWAAGCGHEAVVRLLLEKGASVTAKDQRDQTALHWAAGYGHEAVVRQLLEKGANVTAKDQSDQTALHWAAGYGHEAVVRLLLEKAANVTAKDQFGETALHLAASKGHEAVVRLLLEKGANVAAKDQFERTALHLATSQGHKAVVRLLRSA